MKCLCTHIETARTLYLCICTAYVQWRSRGGGRVGGWGGREEGAMLLQCVRKKNTAKFMLDTLA